MQDGASTLLPTLHPDLLGSAHKVRMVVVVCQETPFTSLTGSGEQLLL